MTEQLIDECLDPGAILIEPVRRNTAQAFRDAVKIGEAAAHDGKLVTFGVKPTHPETSYGYLELSERHVETDSHPLGLERFIEKPDVITAEGMCASGKYFWNSGIFLFSAKAVIKAFESYSPAMMAAVATSVEKAEIDLGFLRLDEHAWAEIDDISIDYAVMERADNLVVVPFSAGWSDLGGWDAVWRESERDNKGVALSGSATAIECGNSLLRSEDDEMEIVGIGLDNVIAIAMPDAMLVADASRAQDVRLAVDALKRKKSRQAESFPLDHRPRGWFESLVNGIRFQVKRIVVKPAGALSLQSHHHRAEHWIVVEGTARVTVRGEARLITENQSVYIPVGDMHRLENPGKLPVVLIKLQTGVYFEEDDIIRYDDVYARG